MIAPALCHIALKSAKAGPHGQRRIRRHGLLPGCRLGITPLTSTCRLKPGPVDKWGSAARAGPPSPELSPEETGGSQSHGVEEEWRPAAFAAHT